MSAIDPAFAWSKFLARDRRFDGQFVGAVKTTKIYCKPSCPVRHPKPQNVMFYRTAAEAKLAGFRACLRCRPDEIARDEVAIQSALALLANEAPPALEELAKAVGYAPHHFHRLFKRATGVTPAAYARGLRARRAEAALSDEGSVTDAIYAAGYSGPSRFYEETKGRLGMTPSAWKNGGAGSTIHWAVVETSLGAMLVAATARGVCRLAFNEGREALETRFAKAELIEGGADFADLLGMVIASVEAPGDFSHIPLDVKGTAFQEACWRELQRIPAGETRSYAQIAAAAGNPKAVRAAGSANGANNIAVLIPCHRVIRSDGSLGGYAYGLEIKRKLLAKESGQ
jgi:AraC family transcriptional regulator of adaptative response/methylated-DNA-[protein]-cysteine methyltransferase